MVKIFVLYIIATGEIISGGTYREPIAESTKAMIQRMTVSNPGAQCIYLDSDYLPSKDKFKIVAGKVVLRPEADILADVKLAKKQSLLAEGLGIISAAYKPAERELLTALLALPGYDEAKKAKIVRIVQWCGAVALKTAEAQARADAAETASDVAGIQIKDVPVSPGITMAEVM
jgi:hypothetical protein